MENDKILSILTAISPRIPLQSHPNESMSKIKAQLIIIEYGQGTPRSSAYGQAQGNWSPMFSISGRLSSPRLQRSLVLFNYVNGFCSELCDAIVTNVSKFYPGTSEDNARQQFSKIYDHIPGKVSNIQSYILYWWSFNFFVKNQPSLIYFVT